jgi:hypothetical protein
MPSILSVLSQPGDQEIVLPDGIYTAGLLDAATTPGIKHPETNGPFGGHLVVRSQTPGGVKIVGAGANRIFELKNAERISFIGVDTKDLVVRPYGCKSVYWWYGDTTYPVENHPQFPDSVPASGNTTPSGFIGDQAGGSKNVDLRWYGMDVHDCGDDGFRLKNTQALWQGCTWDEIAHHNYPPGSEFHNDCIQTMGGSDFTVLDAYMHPHAPGHAGSDAGLMWIIEAASNSIVGRVERLWHDGPGWGAPLQFHRRDTANPGTTVTVSLKDVWAWGHGGTSPIAKSGTGVTVTQTNVNTTQPTGDNPAVKWRNEHPYGSWKDFFEWGSNTPNPVQVPVTVTVRDSAGHEASEIVNVAVQ